MNRASILSKMFIWVLRQAFGVKTPIIAVYSLTHYCNFYCPMCPFGTKDKAEQARLAEEKDLKTWQWKQIMSKVSRYTIAACVEGGEPTTREDLPELLEHLKSLGVYVNLTTNSSLLHKLPMDRLAKSTDAVCCSLDSIYEDAFCKIRGVYPEVFHMVQSNIKMLGDYGMVYYTNPVITKYNVEEFASGEYFDYVYRELGVVAVMPSVVENFEAEGSSMLLPSRSQLKKLARGVLDYMKRRDKPYIGTPPLYWKQILEYGRPIYDRCRTWRGITVQADGTVRIPCWKFAVPTEVFNIMEHEVAELWRHPAWKNSEGCHRCEYLACHWFSSQRLPTIAKNYFKGVGYFLRRS